MFRPLNFRWFHFLPIFHFCVCLISYVGLLLPNVQNLGKLLALIVLVDLPISLPAYFLGWKYPAPALVWVLIAGTFWWYVLGGGVKFLSDSLRGLRPTVLFAVDQSHKKL